MNKNNLLKNLKKDIYCRVKASKIHGIGVFAIKDIPKNTDPFKLTNNKIIKYNFKKITGQEIKKLDKEVAKMIQDYFAKEVNGDYYIPALGLNSLDISFYMNHSNKPNVKIIDSKLHDAVVFKTNKTIKKGTELFIDYSDYDNM